MGLNEVYIVVQGSMLTMNSLPSLAQAFLYWSKMRNNERLNQATRCLLNPPHWMSPSQVIRYLLNPLHWMWIIPNQTPTESITLLLVTTLLGMGGLYQCVITTRSLDTLKTCAINYMDTLRIKIRIPIKVKIRTRDLTRGRG